MQGDVETAWQIFHKAAEDYLEWLCNEVSEEKSPAGERGRGKLPKLVEREVAATARNSADLQPETATVRRIAKTLRRVREMKTKMDRDEETIVTQAETILLWSAMSRDEILKKLPCAEMLDKQLPTKSDLVTMEKEASDHEKKFNRDLKDIRIRTWRNRMKAALTSEARRKDWQTVRNFMKVERMKPIEAIEITEEDDDAINHGEKRYAIESTSILRHVNTAWDKIFQRVAEGTIEQFVERYSNYIVPARCQIDVITAANLQKGFRKNEQKQSCCALWL